MKYKYSIIIPVYNVEKYVERCVESFEKQEYKNYELILIDDGSRDSSGTICDNLQEKYQNIRSFHKENGGLADTRNFGLNHAYGDYILFVDSDDTVTSDYFSFLNSEIDDHYDMVKFGFQVIQNNKIASKSAPYYDEGVYIGKKILEEIIPGVVGPQIPFSNDGTALLSACVCAYNRDFLSSNDIKFTSERLVQNEDYLFNYEALIKANKIKICKSIHYNYITREGSLTRRYVPDMLQKKIRLIECYKKILLDHELFLSMKDRFYNQVIIDFYECLTNECNQYSNNKKEAIKIINFIMNNGLLREAINESKNNGLSVKGKLIICMMKMRMSSSFYLLYHYKSTGRK